MKPPAFQCYADDLLAGTSDMTAEEFGVYWRLICHSWNKGALPNDDQRLALMAGQCSGNAVAYAKTKFALGEDGLLRNPRLEKVRIEQEEYRKKQSENAKSGWEKRRHPEEIARNATAMPPHKASLCSPSPTPSPAPLKTSVPSQTSQSRPHVNGTMLTFSMLDRVAKAIKNNEQGWHYPEHKVNRDEIVAARLTGKMLPYLNRITEKQVHEAWQEAATRTHAAVKDELVESTPEGYCVACWLEQMTNIAEKVNAKS